MDRAALLDSQRHRAAFLHYWASTVTANDKNALIATRGVVEWQINHMRDGQQPATNELHVRAIFDMGISSAHKQAVSIRNPQPPSDLHSTIHLYEDVVFGEPDYLLRNPNSLRVTGVCEAKSPWNIGPSEIDDVLSGSNKIH